MKTKQTKAKYFIPILGGYYHFMSESAVAMYQMLQEESLLGSLDCRLWYQGPFGEVVQMFSRHPIVNVPVVSPYLTDASTIGPDIRTLKHTYLRREHFHQLVPMVGFLSDRIPLMEMEKGITLIKRDKIRVYLETDELAEQLRRFQLPVRVVQLEKESFASQVNLMRNTLILIAPHGAGTLNQIFMPPGGQIIELFPKGDSNWHAKAVADVFGHSLSEIESELPGPYGVEPSEFIRRIIADNGWPDRETVNEFHRSGLREICRVIRGVRSYSIPPERILKVVEDSIMNI